MAHSAVIRGVQAALGELGDGLAVLDLGCGDAEAGDHRMPARPLSESRNHYRQRLPSDLNRPHSLSKT
jgi:hypothetical protein